MKERKIVFTYEDHNEEVFNIIAKLLIRLTDEEEKKDED